MPATCPRCNGAGRLITGTEAREFRAAAGLGLRETARRMELDPSYLVDLEADRRNWNADLETRFRTALV